MTSSDDEASPSAFPTTDLPLGDPAGEEHARRLLLVGSHVIAYGGNHGTIVLVSNNQVVRRFDEAIRAVAVSKDLLRVAVGFDDGSTQIFSYEASAVNQQELHPFLATFQEKEDDDFLSQSEGLASQDHKGETIFAGPRFEAPVRSLAFDPRSYMLAIAHEAGMCVVHVTSSSTLEKRFLEQAAERDHDSSGIRSLSYSSFNNDQMWLASLGMDGRLCVWDVTCPNDDPELDYELLHRDASLLTAPKDVGEIHGADPYVRSCNVVFTKSYLALPGGPDVQLRSLDTLSQPLFLSSTPDQGHVDSIVRLATSPDGRYLVSSGRDGRVVVWELNKDNKGAKDDEAPVVGQWIHQWQCPSGSIPTDVLWWNSGNEDQLHLACANGSLVSVLGRDKIVPQTKAAVLRQEEEEKQDTDAPSDDDTVDFSSDDTKKKKVSFVVEEAEEDDDDDDVPTDNVATGVAARATEEEEDSPDDDDDALLGEEDFSPTPRPHPPALLPDPQPAFAPSSTPLDLQRRILCWNHVGAVSLSRGSPHNVVDIDFTDAATRRPLTFTDNLNFILGSLGEDGGIFCTDLVDQDDDDDDEAQDVQEMVDGLHMSERTKALVRKSHRQRKHGQEKANGSSVYFHRFETFGALRDKDWHLALPDGERAMGCACGEGWAAVITSRRFLRFFSSGGNQGQVAWLKGDPVTIVGRSMFAAVIYHEGNPLVDGTQKLGYSLFDAVSSKLISSGSVSCISSGSKLEWAGFSNDCSLMVMDSDGMLSMLVGTTKSSENQIDSFSWDWSPMLDTVGLRKSVDDKFFPITCQDGKLVCVPLKGGNEYPDAARRPVTTTLSLRMPLARGNLEKSAPLEELSVRANIALTQKKFVNEMTALDAADRDELEEEYDGLCAQVDKVTLKLFMATVETGKLERALDLVERLHLEKSFDIAITVADRLNHRNLSDRIDAARERRFALEEEPMEDFSPEYESTTHDDHEEASTRVSPDFEQSKGLRKRHVEQDGEEDWEDARSGPPKKMRPLNAKTTLVKQTNPFAKKRLESPARPSLSPAKSPSKLSLSRSSTFSTQSREKAKVSKLIL